MEERLPPTPAPGSLPRTEQFSDINAVAHLVLVERGERRELPVDRRCAEMRLDQGQHRQDAVATRGWQPQPGDELADVLEPHLSPVETLGGQELPVVLQVVRVGADGVRRPLDVGQIREEPFDRLDRDVVVAEHRPRLDPTRRCCHPLNLHRSST
jgi:hypothetical protein